MIDTYLKQFTASGGAPDMKGSNVTTKTTIAAFVARANWISYTVKVKGQTMTLTVATTTNDRSIKNLQIMTLPPPRLTARALVLPYVAPSEEASGRF